MAKPKSTKAPVRRVPRSYVAVKVHVDLERSGYKGCPPSMYQVWETCFENDRAQGGCPHALACSCFRVEVGALKRFESAYETWPEAVASAEVLNADFAPVPLASGEFKAVGAGPVMSSPVADDDVPF